MALVGVCIVGAVCGRLAYLPYPFLNDAGVYVLMGKTVVNGGRLYQDFYETKFPGVAVLMAGCWRLFGAHWGLYVLLQLAMTLLGAWAMARETSRHLGREAGLAAGLFTLVFLNVPQIVFGGFQLETVQAFLSILSACAAMRSAAHWHFARCDCMRALQRVARRW